MEENSNSATEIEKAAPKTREPPTNNLVKSWQTVVQRFCQSTTMHGVSRLVDSTRITFKLLWFVTVLGFLCILLWQAVLLVDEYTNHPSTTHIQLVTKTKLQFPAVTVCNMNRLRRSKLPGTRFQELLDLDRQVSLYNLGLEDEIPEETGSGGRTKRPRPRRPSTTIAPDQTESPITEGTVELRLTTNGTTDDGTTTLQENAGNTTIDPLSTNLPDDEVVQHSTSGPRRKRQVADSPKSASYGKTGAHRHVVAAPGLPSIYIPLIGADPESDHSNWGRLFELSATDDFRDFIGSVNPSRRELSVLGHQAEDFIIQCSFNQLQCDYRNFSRFYTTQYGNCYTFNRPDVNKSILETGKTGSQYGLHLTLFTEESEYIGLLTHQSGVRVAIHQPNVRPFPEDDGITASTGTLTSIGLRQRNITRLGNKFGKCRDTSDPSQASIDGFDYTIRACLNACYQKKLRYECGCASDVMADTTQCSTLDSHQESCLHEIDRMAMESELKCDCPTPCREIDYDRFASFSKWPTDSADRHLRKKLNKKARKMGNMTMDTAFRRKNMVRLEIFYEKLNYELYKQVAKYTFEGLIGGIGGIMGFFAGMSLITLFELTGFIIQLAGLLVGKLTEPIEAEEGVPHETRIGKMGRRLTLALSNRPSRRSGRGDDDDCPRVDL
ncbi:epithelial sodium channel subunit beta-like [Diadema setosum]|uniref:epithelial sodium channel subunit beta-like n=1 Tax=Diadema setosum TaxID=31175 RepID=UPI003B3A5449